MKTTIAITAAALVAFSAPAFAAGHSQVAAEMVGDIKNNTVAGPGKSAGSNASLLKGGWGNRADEGIDGPSTTGPAQVTGKPPIASVKTK